MSRKIVALGWELMAIEHTINGARVLIDGVNHQQFGNTEDEQAASLAASATLSLVSLRLRDLTRAVQGMTDPAHTIWAPHNAASNPRRGDDVYLAERARAKPSRRSRYQRR